MRHQVHQWLHSRSSLLTVEEGHRDAGTDSTTEPLVVKMSNQLEQIKPIRTTKHLNNWSVRHVAVTIAKGCSQPLRDGNKLNQKEAPSLMR